MINELNGILSIIWQLESMEIDAIDNRRMIDAILTNTVVLRIRLEVLLRMMDAKPIERVHVKGEDGKFGYGFE